MRLTRLFRVLLVAMLALVAVIGSASSSTATTPGVGATYAYDAASNTPRATSGAGFGNAAVYVRTGSSTGASTGRASAVSAGFVAADTALTENQIGSTTEDILANATRGKVSTAVQYTKAGGFDQANSDFDLLTRGVDVVDRGGGLRTATLSNGTKVNVRPFSSGKIPTLEIDTPGNPVIKVRY